jgi:hypothetical protein
LSHPLDGEFRLGKMMNNTNGERDIERVGFRKFINRLMPNLETRIAGKVCAGCGERAVINVDGDAAGRLF